MRDENGTGPTVRGMTKRPEENEQGPDQERRPLNRRRLVTFAVAGFLLALLLTPAPTSSIEPGKTAKLSEVTSAVRDSKVEEAWIDEKAQKVTVELKGGSRLTAIYPVQWQRELATKLDDAGVVFTTVPVQRQNAFLGLMFSLIPTLLIVGVLVWLMRKNGLGGIGKLTKKTEPIEIPNVRFSDVAGVDEAVEELREVVEYLHDPTKFSVTGGKPSKGFLLIGPPGTGKTLLARAVAGEAGVPFFAVSGSDFVEVFAGMGASRVRALFERARSAGRAILFIDEIDAIGRARGGQGFASGANDEREQTLNQILVELDGFISSDVIILAATNRPDVLDPALTRPGRFDRKIVVPAPDRKGRQTIMELYTKDKPFDSTIDWAGFARRTPGLTGADIALLVNEAAMEAARTGKDVIAAEHVEAALATTVLGRERRSAVVSDRDRNIVAWHEAGHAVAALVLPDADDPVTISIVPRGGAGGVTWMSGNDNDFMTRSQALARLTVSMAGRAAEEVLLDGDFTQGAHGDISAATALAREMVTRYGMGERLVARAETMPIGEDPVHDEIAHMLGSALVQARQTLRKHGRLLEELAAMLLDEENVSLEQLEALTARVDPKVTRNRAASAPAPERGRSRSTTKRPITLRARRTDR